MILQSIEIDINNIIWNYQDWILKILESLKNAKFISKYDYNNNWENIIYKLTELMKLWNLIHNIVKAIVYIIYYNTFMIMITWT